MGDRLDNTGIVIAVGGIVGRLTIIERIGSNKHGASMWKCRCSCGNEIEANNNSLMYYKRSCGCLHKENTLARNKEKRDKYIGMTFGYLTVIGFEDTSVDGHFRNAICKCSLCGNICVKPVRSLLAGVKSCGCSTHSLQSVSQGGTGVSGECQGIRQFIRTCPEGLAWKRACLEKAEYKCQITGINSNKLEIHHIVSQSELLKLHSITVENYKNYLVELFDVANGLVMLKEYHKSLHRKYGNSPTIEQLTVFIQEQRELIKE